MHFLKKKKTILHFDLVSCAGSSELAGGPEEDPPCALNAKKPTTGRARPRGRLVSAVMMAAARDDPNQKSRRKPPPAASWRLSDYATLALALLPMFFAVLLLLSLPRALGERGALILNQALERAFKGGVPGFVSAIVQIGFSCGCEQRSITSTRRADHLERHRSSGGRVACGGSTVVCPRHCTGSTITVRRYSRQRECSRLENSTWTNNAA